MTADPHPRLGTRENPCTLDNSRREERGFKYCRCSRCAKVAVCTPEHDFFETPIAAPERLECEPCHIGGMAVIEIGQRKGYA